MGKHTLAALSTGKRLPSVGTGSNYLSAFFAPCNQSKTPELLQPGCGRAYSGASSELLRKPACTVTDGGHYAFVSKGHAPKKSSSAKVICRTAVNYQAGE